MKKQLLICSILCVAAFSNAQNDMVLDTIYANDKKNVALFFPNTIRQGITGSDNFVFTYNREKGQYFGLLQASLGEDSNLLVITNDGQVYAYILKYTDTISMLNHFISETESIGNEKPILKSKKADTVIKEKGDNVAYYNRFSEYLLQLKHVSIATKRKKGMVLKLLELKYHKNEVYMVLEIKNRSGIDFDVDYVNVYRVNANNRQKASSQRLKQNVAYKYKIPKTVSNGNVERFVYVLPKFVLGDNEKLEIELMEQKGGRSLFLLSKNL